jgi:ankyrin repeat protein
MEIKKTFHDAAKQGDLAAIGAHLSEQSDVNATDKLHRTPLHLAAWAGQKVWNHHQADFFGHEDRLE